MGVRTVRQSLAVLLTLSGVACARGPAWSAQDAPQVVAVAVSPDKVKAGARPSLGGVLVSAAPRADIAISLSSSNRAAASVPSSVTIPKGQTRATFPVTIGFPSVPLTATITATFGRSSARTDVQVQAPPVQVASVAPNPEQVGIGKQFTVQVILTAPPPAGGAHVTLTFLPPHIVEGSATQTVVQKALTGTYTFTAASWTSEQPLYIRGYVRASTASSIKSAELWVNRGLSDSTTPTEVFTPGPGYGLGLSGKLTIVLSGPAPSGGVTVRLSCDRPRSLKLPAVVTVPAGQSRVDVPVTGGSEPGSVTITATVGKVSIRRRCEVVAPAGR